MSTATTTETRYTAAAELADVLPPVKQRGKVATFIRRHPTIVAGGFDRNHAFQLAGES